MPSPTPNGTSVADALRPVAEAIDPASLDHSARLSGLIAARIDASGGWVGFDRYMHWALYEPALGYYAAKPGKIGAGGDFVTAPEISPLFARTLATQLAQVFESVPARVLEFGAGNGVLSAGLIDELHALGCPLRGYDIVEVSADLRQEQQRVLAPAAARDVPVRWLDAPPAAFEGAIVANEVLDVMPVRLFVKRGGRAMERGVSVQDGVLRFAERDADAELAAEVARIEARAGVLPDGYGSEIGLVAQAWTSSLGAWLARGVALLIDYGFPLVEYYHPQRAMGTLMCHLRHRSHAEPLWLPGLNDITAHVDFSAIARAARGAGLQLMGYTSQARFLMNCGLLDRLGGGGRVDPAAAAGALKLLSEAEMGELVKVMAVGRGVELELLGFASGDRSHRLE